MMKTTRLFFSVLSAISLMFSCEPFEKVSDVPEIHFKKLEGPFMIQKGNIISYGADLTFSFIDGNSDIGVDMSSHPEDTINLFLIPFEKVDGMYDPVDSVLYGQRFTIKNNEKMDRSGRTIRGEIKVQLTYILKPPFDTLRYEFYLTDRAGNKSNVETSSDIAY